MPTLDIVDSPHVSHGMKPPFCENQFGSSRPSDIFEKLATADELELSPSSVEPYPRCEVEDESASPRSTSRSPIAALRVDNEAEPLDRYRQALTRSHQ